MKKTLPSKDDFKVHYLGDQNSVRTVLYIHGFGVNSNSKGLFTDLAQALAKINLGAALFNLSHYDEMGNATFLNLRAQQARIRKVYQEVLDKDRGRTPVVVAHSMGCGVLSSLLPELTFKQVLLLAPAADYPGRRIKQHLIKSYQAKEVAPKLYAFRRKNGTTSYFSQSYVDEFTIKFSQLYDQHWSAVADLKVCTAGADQANYDQTMLNILAKTNHQLLPKADHNFTGENRLEIIKLAADFFSQK